MLEIVHSIQTKCTERCVPIYTCPVFHSWSSCQNVLILQVENNSSQDIIHVIIVFIFVSVYMEHKCSCYIEFIERFAEKILNARLVEHLVSFPNKFNKFNKTGARMIDSIFHYEIAFLRINTKSWPILRYFITTLNKKRYQNL